MTKDEILFAIQEVVAHAGGEWPDTAGEPEVLRRVKMLARMAASHGQAPAQPDQPIACSYGDNGYACCEGGPCQADVHNDKLAEQQAPATAPAEESVPAPAPPPECETEAEKRAFAFGWFKVLESERRKADSVQAAQVGAVESNTADAAPTQGATEMENLQRTAVGWQGRALRAERNWAVCRRWAIAGGAPVEKLGDDPDQPFHAASPAIGGEQVAALPSLRPGPADGESNV